MPIEDSSPNDESLPSQPRLYKLLVNSVKDYAIFMLDPSGYIITWNIGAQRIKGYSSEEIIGKHFSVFYLPQAQQTGFPRYELEVAAREGRFEDEGYRVRKDGSLFWANVVITAVFDPQQGHIGYAKVTRDLSERVRNEELMKKNQELLRINKDLDTFIYSASHDLKAPIVNIEGLLKALRREQGKDKPNEEKIEHMYGLLFGAVDRFKVTIRDLTEVVRISKETPEDRANIPLEEVLREVLLDLEPQLQEASGAVDLQLLCDQVHFSRRDLKSLFHNLLSNAVKYRSPERKPRILVRCWREDASIHVSVQDNGLGIPQAGLEKIFSMFKRLHNHVEGTGMGLFIVKKIIEDAGGKIRVDSQAGVGSTFTLSFPT
jgi:PAS domain S-box-containing protein